MKKTLVLSAAILLLAGCGNTVKCTMKSDNSKEQTTVTGKFKKGNLQSYTYTVKYDSKSDAKESCKSAKEIYGDEGKVKCSGKKVSATISKPKSAKTEITKDDFIKQFESSGATCK